jgi:hypothetical protein
MRSTIQLFLRKCQLLLAGAVACFALAGLAQTETASASPGSCSWQGYWTCGWINTNLAPGVADWFEAGNNLRPWYAASINGYDHGGYTVTQKCVHVVRGSDGAQAQVACGWGTQSGGIGGAWQPGYLFMRHGASGPRSLIGRGNH